MYVRALQAIPLAAFFKFGAQCACVYVCMHACMQTSICTNQTAVTYMHTYHFVVVILQLLSRDRPAKSAALCHMYVSM